ncbi:MAG: Uma2 family endonuclease [Gammaproteobacteria bacterium]|nr:Uma2 family endonuclease [Gammaproteobacteria bacterium]
MRAQSPVRLDFHTEVQPDVAVVKRRDDDYESRHPTPADVLLLVEVSDATLRYALEAKAPLYARHGIPELWIVDLQADLLHFRSAPVAGRYSAAFSRADAGLTEIGSLPGARIDLSALFRAERN